jgi:hypothetical protein
MEAFLSFAPKLDFGKTKDRVSLQPFSFLHFGIIEIE